MATDFSKENAPKISKEAAVCPAKISTRRFFDDQTGNSARTDLRERSDPASETGERWLNF
jgi:hypothetical protein